MQTVEILQAIRSLLEQLQETKSDNFSELSRRLNQMQEYFDATLSRIHSGEAEDALDLDFKIDDALALAKQVIQEIYKRAVLPLPREAARAAYASATDLQWELGEHDIPFSPRKPGYAASTAEEVNQVLDRIESER
ncbi:MULTISPECIES: hypothetical protein [unclassified Duganella]|uniref:hypothetical protein n=1 Tax=unclassified Duganella TaxID=2636909 RepID=UPI000E343C03|nr:MULTISPECIES: hypothetical protein [unclassified Duganella]RFP18639.1 hypothetical protein D0T23_02260 [Duganella sp. BJB475]RFP35304.1 hypothetical protein D0T21_02260 [Duganella sp. BJB476]